MPRKKSDIPAETPLQVATSTLGAYIDEHKLRHTPERLSVLEAVMEKGGRFTVDEIAAEMVQRKVNVCRATVVNTLHVLEKAGLVLKVGTHGRFVLYQKAPKRSRKNMGARLPFSISLQCTECGAVREVRDRAATAALASRRFTSFTPTGGVVTIFGLCGNCKAQTNNEKTQNK